MKETQKGCLSRPIRIKSELFRKFRFSGRLAKMFFDSLQKHREVISRCFLVSALKPRKRIHFLHKQVVEQRDHAPHAEHRKHRA